MERGEREPSSCVERVRAQTLLGLCFVYRSPLNLNIPRTTKRDKSIEEYHIINGACALLKGEGVGLISLYEAASAILVSWKLTRHLSWAYICSSYGASCKMFLVYDTS